MNNRTRADFLRLFLPVIGSASAVAVVLLTGLEIDYGFAGALLPVFAALTHPPKNAPQYFEKIDTPPVILSVFAVGLLILAAINRPIQYFSLLSLSLLALYSGKRGKFKMKYFFYIFYPTHLAVLWIIFVLLSNK